MDQTERRPPLHSHHHVHVHVWDWFSVYVCGVAWATRPVPRAVPPQPWPWSHIVVSELKLS